MYELIPVGAHTYYIDCPAKIGVYVHGDGQAALIDSGSDAGAAPGTEEIAFTFHQDKEAFPTVTLTFSQYDSSSCLVTLNGESRLLVSRDGLLDLMDTFRTLLQGE